jgi:hypothetical protein
MPTSEIKTISPYRRLKLFKPRLSTINECSSSLDGENSQSENELIILSQYFPGKDQKLSVEERHALYVAQTCMTRVSYACTSVAVYGGDEQ